MKSKKVNRYYCDFCRKGRFSEKWMLRHEATCHKNPNRVPYEGELTHIRQTGTYKDYSSSDGPWFEWVPFDTMPSWWPGEGKIFHDGQWHDVPGYKTTRAKPGHGCAGGACDDEEWPKRIHELPAAYRWDAVFRNGP